MKTKLLELTKSISFWYCVILTIAFFLDSINVLPGAYAKTLELFTALGIVIKRVDKFSER